MSSSSGESSAAGGSSILSYTRYQSQSGGKKKSPPTHRDVLRRGVAHERVTDDVHFPREETGVGRALELDFIRAIVSLLVVFGVWDVGDLDGGHNDAVGLVVRENDPP